MANPTAPAAAATAPTPTFLGIPSELRLMIIEQVEGIPELIFQTDITYSGVLSISENAHCRRVNEKALDTVHALLRVSQQINAESTPEFAGRDRDGDNYVDFRIYHRNTDANPINPVNFGSKFTPSTRFFQLLPMALAIKFVDFPRGVTLGEDSGWGSLFDFQLDQVERAIAGKPRVMEIMKRYLTLKVTNADPRGWELESRVGLKKPDDEHTQWRTLEKYSTKIYGRMAGGNIAGSFDPVFLVNFLWTVRQWESAE